MHPAPPTTEVQKLLFDEWKYRHEMFHKTVSRYARFYVFLALLPSVACSVASVATGVAAESKPTTDVIRLIANLFSGACQPGWGPARTTYWAVVLVFFGGTNWHLSQEHGCLKGVEGRMSPEFRPTKGKF